MVQRVRLVHRPIPRALLYHARKIANAFSPSPVCSWGQLAQICNAGVSIQQRKSGGAADVAHNARVLSRCCYPKIATCLAAEGALRWAEQSWGGGSESRGGDVAMG
jgi:hypothetical protein